MFYILLFLFLSLFSLSVSVHSSSTTFLLLYLFTFYPTSLITLVSFILYIFLGRWRLSDPHRILTTPAASSPSRGSLSFLIPTLYSFLSYVPVPYIGRRFWQDGDLLRKQSSYRPFPDPALVSRGESILLVLSGIIRRQLTDIASSSSPP